MAADAEDRAAVRNAGSLVGLVGLDVVRAVLFVALVPRLLGPADFGRLALLNTVVLGFAMLSGLGSTQLLGRFVPVLTLRGEVEESRRLLGGLLAVRTLSGIGGALLVGLLGWFWLADLPRFVVVVMASTVVLRNVSGVLFGYLLGSNQAQRWGFGEAVRRWGVLGFVLAGTWLGGLRGAAVGTLAAEVAVALLGLRWVWPQLRWSHLRLDRVFLGPYLRFNVLFFGSNLLFVLSLRGGEAVLRGAQRPWEEVGYLAVAAAGYVLVCHHLWTVLNAFLPLLCRWRELGRVALAAQHSERFLRLLAAATLVGTAGLMAWGDPLVPWLAGAAFAPAAALLPALGLAALFQVSASVGRLLCLALDRPRVALAAGLAQLVALIGCGWPLVVRFHGVGAAVALAVSAAAGAATFAVGLRGAAGVPRLGRWFGVVLAGFVVLGVAPVALGEAGVLERTTLWLVLSLVYLAVLVRLGWLSRDDFSVVAAAVAEVRGRTGPAPTPVDLEPAPAGPGYWNGIGRPGHQSRPPSLWRAHCDRINTRWLGRHLSPDVGRVLVTDLFDEAVGVGSYPHLAAGSQQVLGIDLAVAQVHEARSRYPGLCGVVADVRALPWRDQSLDVVVSLSTLDHFTSHAALQAGLAELHRVLRPGGTLLLTLDNEANPVVALRNWLPFGLLRATGLVPYFVGVSGGPRQLRSWLDGAGFEVESLGALQHGPRVLAVAAARLLDRWAGRGLGRGFLLGLRTFEVLGRLPTRFATGYYVAAVATRRAAPQPSGLR